MDQENFSDAELENKSVRGNFKQFLGNCKLQIPDDFDSKNYPVLE